MNSRQQYFRKVLFKTDLNNTKRRFGVFTTKTSVVKRLFLTLFRRLIYFQPDKGIMNTIWELLFRFKLVRYWRWNDSDKIPFMVHLIQRSVLLIPMLKYVSFARWPVYHSCCSIHTTEQSVDFRYLHLWLQLFSVLAFFSNDEMFLYFMACLKCSTRSLSERDLLLLKQALFCSI